MKTLVNKVPPPKDEEPDAPAESEVITLPPWAAKVLGEATATVFAKKSYPPNLDMEQDRVYIVTFNEEVPRTVTGKYGDRGVIQVTDPEGTKWSLWVQHKDFVLKLVLEGPNLLGRTYQISRRKRDKYWNYTLVEEK